MRAELRLAALLASLALLAACRPAPTPATSPSLSGALPVDTYARLAAAGEDVFELVPEASRIDVVVRRDGPLARFGHDHVVVAAPEGLAASTGDTWRADLRFALDDLQVDPPDGRARHGLPAGPDAGDIEGTRRNMLDTSLEAANWPAVRIAARLPSPGRDTAQATLDIELHGRRRSVEVPVRLERTRATTTVHARFDLRQSDFGIEPYSALGGGLRVADTLELHAALHFARAAPDGMHGGRRSE